MTASLFTVQHRKEIVWR